VFVEGFISTLFVERLLTVIVTVETLLSSVPSFALNVKLSLPLKLELGV